MEAAFHPLGEGAAGTRHRDIQLFSDQRPSVLSEEEIERLPLIVAT